MAVIHTNWQPDLCCSSTLWDELSHRAEYLCHCGESQSFEFCNVLSSDACRLSYPVIIYWRWRLSQNFEDCPWCFVGNSVEQEGLVTQLLMPWEWGWWCHMVVAVWETGSECVRVCARKGGLGTSVWHVLCVGMTRKFFLLEVCEWHIRIFYFEAKGFRSALKMEECIICHMDMSYCN